MLDLRCLDGQTRQRVLINRLELTGFLTSTGCHAFYGRRLEHLVVEKKTSVSVNSFFVTLRAAEILVGSQGRAHKNLQARCQIFRQSVLGAKQLVYLLWFVSSIFLHLRTMAGLDDVHSDNETEVLTGPFVGASVSSPAFTLVDDACVPQRDPAQFAVPISMLLHKSAQFAAPMPPQLPLNTSQSLSAHHAGLQAQVVALEATSIAATAGACSRGSPNDSDHLVDFTCNDAACLEAHITTHQAWKTARVPTKQRLKFKKSTKRKENLRRCWMRIWHPCSDHSRRVMAKTYMTQGCQPSHIMKCVTSAQPMVMCSLSHCPMLSLDQKRSYKRP